MALFPEPDCDGPLLENGRVVGKNSTFFAEETAEVVCENGFRYMAM